MYGNKLTSTHEETCAAFLKSTECVAHTIFRLLNKCLQDIDDLPCYLQSLISVLSTDLSMFYKSLRKYEWQDVELILSLSCKVTLK